MEYVNLGNSDLKVSKVCLGCMSFGDSSTGHHSWTLPYEESKEIIKHALDNGINYFDTAMIYQNGTSEEYLGRIIRELTKRENVIIATKIAAKGSYQSRKNQSTYDFIEEMLDKSLKRLQFDYIDIYILHWWDYRVPIEEYLEAFHRLVQKGKIRYIGVSNCFAWQVARANEIARQHGWPQFISIQSHYNLIMREDERELIPYCKLGNVAITPYSPLAAGKLARRPGETTKRSENDTIAKSKYDKASEQDQGIINRVLELADKKGVSMPEISLAWLLHKGAVPIFAATKKSHIESAAKAASVKLTPEEITYLEELYTPHVLTGVMAGNNSAEKMFNMDE
ncbi:hypothetical protein M9Y10_033155 [Tritrichomonas musculus]|uniref:NADP-dependent oxidoreductase domain-containing protein n=1 Tax=Tritrichomonas musculus TaxID=1915356 RepID=A0ABR2GY86_9EUKA